VTNIATNADFLRSAEIVYNPLGKWLEHMLKPERFTVVEDHSVRWFAMTTDDPPLDVNRSRLKVGKEVPTLRLMENSYDDPIVLHVDGDHLVDAGKLERQAIGMITDEHEPEW
jgi:hypothetical protein